MIKAMASQEHQNFENLLRAVVNVPAATIKRRINEEQANRDWIKEDKQPLPRTRKPIASLVPGGSSRKKT